MELSSVAAYATIVAAVFAALAFLRVDARVVAAITRKSVAGAPPSRRETLLTILCSIALVMGSVSLYISQKPGLNALAPFTATGIGCTPTNPIGDGAAGTFTLGAGPCTAVMITIGAPLTAPNGWRCIVGDKTQQARGVWFGEWSESASTETAATIPIPQAAAPTDVIGFACTRY